MSAEQKQNEVLLHLAKMSRSLRNAIAAALPCASEQYVTISMPGLVIDTSASSPFIPKEPVTLGRRNAITVNEAKLVDNMVPLDQIMLGPTGKSVTRSYSNALDFLKPRDTTIGIFDKNVNAEKTEYSDALKFLKQRIEVPETSSLKDVNLGNTDFDGTVVGRYVRKQLAWAEAQGNWDAVRDDAEEDLELRGAQQTAAVIREKKILSRKRKAELQARWMDWVVNGDKLQVDHSFALVDRSDLMARVERAKEATRDSLVLDPKDGTDWARVYLQPEAWARICRTKANNWSKRNPVNVELLEMQIAKLEQEEIAYKAFESWSDSNLKDEPTFELKATNYNHLEYLNKQKDANDAKKEWQTALKSQGNQIDAQIAAAKATKLAAQTAFDDAKIIKDPPKSGDEMTKLQNAVTAAETAVTDLESKKTNQPGEVARLETAWKKVQGEAETIRQNHPDNRLNLALQNVNDWDQAYRDSQNLVDETQKPGTKDAGKADGSAWNILASIISRADRILRAQSELDAAKDIVFRRKKERDEFKVKEDLFKMRTKNSENTKSAAGADLKNIQTQLVSLREKLREGRKITVSARQAIVDVKPSSGNDKDFVLVRSDPVLTDKAAIATANDGDDIDQADVWTKITFSVSGKTEETGSAGSSYDAEFQAKYSSWYASAEASSHVSSASETLKKSMASCNMSVSFDALLVQIQRPWLHMELFSDYDVDTSKDLSPGAPAVLSCISDLSAENRSKLKTFGTFPAYPTAFIIAADTTLEIQSSDAQAEETMSKLSSDSSFSMNLGPWGVSGGAHLKTNSKNANQRMESKNGSLRISFQAPQIIGWVSEILPELPRRNTTGGLFGVPNQAFRPH